MTKPFTFKFDPNVSGLTNNLSPNKNNASPNNNNRLQIKSKMELREKYKKNLVKSANIPNPYYK